ncbi:MAG: hypothetical protein J0M18_20305, partial [Ignavibacteria bacterium]|nr:hypothetical protein [Ignavibacteria bacterium]
MKILSRLFLLIFFLGFVSQIYSQTWNIKQQGVTRTAVRNVVFVDANTGYAVSADNIGGSYPIFKTTNGGNNWTSYLTSCSNSIYSIAFPNANTGFVCSFNGEVAKTTNGGVNWTEVYQHASNSDLQAIEFFDANTGFAASGLGFYVRTTNGGSSWTETSSPTFAKSSTLINSTTAA